MRGKRREGKSAAFKSHGREERKTEVFERTKMCKFHILGICLRGAECKYAHHVSELQMPPDLSCTKLCTTLLSQGSCNDPDCRYAHAKEELRSMPDATKKVESSDPQVGLFNASMSSEAETLKDPIKIELPMDMLSVQSTTASQSECTFWDSSPETDGTGVSGAWDELSPQSVKKLPWQLDETEKESASKESFWYNGLFEGVNKMPGVMPYGPPGFDPMAYMSQDFGQRGPVPPLPCGNGYDNGMSWGWNSFPGFDLSSVLSQTEGFDASSMQNKWQVEAGRPKTMLDKSEPARVTVRHTKI